MNIKKLAVELRKKLQTQSTYLAGQSFYTAPKYLKSNNALNIFMLRSRGFNADPGNDPDKLAWRKGGPHTHMVFGITSINAEGNKRCPAGPKKT